MPTTATNHAHRDRRNRFVGGFHEQELPFEPWLDRPWLPALERKVLSRDSGSGAVSALVRAPAGALASATGYFTADTEVFVLDGDLTLGQRMLTRYSYSCIPAGQLEGPFSTASGCRFLAFTADRFGFVPSDEGLPAARVNAFVPHRNALNQLWQDHSRYLPYPLPPGVVVKPLLEDPETSASTVVAGHLQHDSSSRPWLSAVAYEEVFCLEGELRQVEPSTSDSTTHAYGPGGYFFRAAGIDPFEAGTETYALVVLRTGLARKNIQGRTST